MPKIVSASSVRPEPTRPGKPEDLARAQRRRRRRAPGRPIGDARAPRAPTSPIVGVDLGEQLVDRAADHHRDERRPRRPRRSARVPTQRAVAQHGDAVGEREDLRHPVADIDDADAALAQPSDDRDQPLHVGSASAAVGSSMIRMRAFWRERLGDLDALAVGDRQRRRPWRRRRGRGCRAVEELPRPRAHRAPVDAAARLARRVAEEDVLGDRQLGEQQQLLVDGGDAGARAARAARRNCISRPSIMDAPASAPWTPGHDLDQRRLAGAVLAEQRVHLAAAARRSRRP